VQYAGRLSFGMLQTMSTRFTSATTPSGPFWSSRVIASGFHIKRLSSSLSSAVFRRQSMTDQLLDDLAATTPHVQYTNEGGARAARWLFDEQMCGCVDVAAVPVPVRYGWCLLVYGTFIHSTWRHCSRVDAQLSQRKRC
jgi:hypothetical protein